MAKILEVAINLPMHTEVYTVGIYGVSEIKDQSAEFESGTQCMYDVYVEGGLYKSIINTPVTITYELEG